jgi:hypothetical protein
MNKHQRIVLLIAGLLVHLPNIPQKVAEGKTHCPADSRPAGAGL